MNQPFSSGNVKWTSDEHWDSAPTSPFREAWSDLRRIKVSHLHSKHCEPLFYSSRLGRQQTGSCSCLCLHPLAGGWLWLDQWAGLMNEWVISKFCLLNITLLSLWACPFLSTSLEDIHGWLMSFCISGDSLEFSHLDHDLISKLRKHRCPPGIVSSRI